MLFKIPNIVGTVYTPGYQPFNPGEPTARWAGHAGLAWNPLPWPAPVGVINALANNSGTPRSRAVLPEVNRYGVLPYNNLFIAGFVGKTQG